MIPLNSTHLVSKKTLAFIATATVGAFSLVSCQQSETPVAQVETPESTQTTEASKPAAESPTLSNLQKAYNGESNAHVMYLAFSTKADEDGYKGVASLFRAAAAAEAIHRDNHAKVIESMGATPQSTITTPEVKSTAENLDKAAGAATKAGLDKAVKGESYERDSMYPDFIEQAKAENNDAALETFQYALAAETQHAQLYTEATKNLEDWKDKEVAFNVCKVSGETTIAGSEAPACPTSGSVSGFETVQ